MTSEATRKLSETQTAETKQTSEISELNRLSLLRANCKFVGGGGGFLLPQSFHFVNSFPPSRVDYFGAFVLLVSRVQFLVIYPVQFTWRTVDDNTTSKHISLKIFYIGDEHFKKRASPHASMFRHRFTTSHRYRRRHYTYQFSHGLCRATSIHLINSCVMNSTPESGVNSMKDEPFELLPPAHNRSFATKTKQNSLAPRVHIEMTRVRTIGGTFGDYHKLQLV